MADLIRPELVRPPPYADNPAASAMTDSTRPLCDCPEPCACYAEGYAADKDKAHFEIRAVLDSKHSGTACTGQ